MKVYRISTQNAQAEKSQALKRNAFIMTTAVLVGFLLGGHALFQAQNFRTVVVVIGFFGAMLVFIVWRSLRQTSRFLADAYSSFEITSDDQAWTKKQKNTPDVTLSRSEIRRVEELQGKGFRICTDDRNRNIWVPCELDGYDQLKNEVQALPGVEMVSKSAAWLRTYLAIAALILLFAVSVLANDKRIAAGASLCVGAYLLVLFFQRYRNPNLTSRGKRQFLWSAFVGAFMLLRAIIIWRS